MTPVNPSIALDSYRSRRCYDTGTEFFSLRMNPHALGVNDASRRVMHSIPFHQSTSWHLNEVVRLDATIQLDQFLSDFVTQNMWENPYPDEVVNSTQHQDGNPDNDVGAVPERDIPLTTGWGVPRHNQQVRVHQDVENGNRVPDLELRSRQVCFVAAPSDKVKPNRHHQVKCGGREDGKVAYWLGVSST